MAVDVDATPESEPRQWPWPWYVVAIVGPLAVLLAGWLILAALASAGWLTSPEVDLPQALHLATQVLLLAHGTPATIGAVPVSLTPLGLSALLVFLALPVASLAARQAASQGADPDDTGKLWVDGEAIVLRVGGTFAGVYAAAVTVLAAVTGMASVRGVIGAVALGAVAGLWGASRGVGHDPTSAWPEWLRAVPRAMAVAVLTVLAGAAALLALTLFGGRGQVTAIVDGLDGGVVGLILLVAVHLCYLPNLVLACASWVLGAGITLGEGSLLTPATTDVGLLPAIPVLGAVPPAGTGGGAHFWWLLTGVLAGVLAGLVVAWARPRARFDETALVGGLAGVVAGVLIAVVGALASGGLGTQRLAHLGARMPELFIFAPTLLGLSGMAAGLVLGLLRRPAPTTAHADDESSA